MATTEQRPGFRLPWANEPRSEPAQGADEALVNTDPATDAVDDGTSTSAVDPRSAPWPSSDGPGNVASNGEARDGAATTTPETETETVADQKARTRRENPLVAGLVRAMRDAAETARQDALTRLADEAKARIEAIQAESAAEAASLRHAVDQDIAEIRERSKAEVARIREETDERIAARKRRLDLEADDQAARIEHRTEHVQTTVEAFEVRMAEFFRMLLNEEDPARLAGFAEQMPELPSFDDEPDFADWSPSHVLDTDDAAAAEAAALADLADLGPTILDDDTAQFDDTAPTPDDATPTRDAGPTPDAGPSPTTRLLVGGLVSVASIAGFKRAVAKASGVEAVSVTAGPNGDFAFTVRHVASLDLAAVVATLDGFTATVTSTEPGELSITASEPDPAD